MVMSRVFFLRKFFGIFWHAYFTKMLGIGPLLLPEVYKEYSLKFWDRGVISFFRMDLGGSSFFSTKTKGGVFFQLKNGGRPKKTDDPPIPKFQRIFFIDLW
jgi:hypothetical protein